MMVMAVRCTALARLAGGGCGGAVAVKGQAEAEAEAKPEAAAGWRCDNVPDNVREEQRRAHASLSLPPSASASRDTDSL